METQVQKPQRRVSFDIAHVCFARKTYCCSTRALLRISSTIIYPYHILLGQASRQFTSIKCIFFPNQLTTALLESR